MRTAHARGPEPTPVAIALIRRGRAFLIRKRPPLPGSPMPGRWEFPGGKCEPGEAPETCARREILEEVGVPIRVVRLRRVVEHVYPHGHVRLHFFDAALDPEGAEPPAGGGFRWCDVRDLPALDFPEANDAIIRELEAESGDAFLSGPDVGP
jgi:mutator protein MutT